MAKLKELRLLIKAIPEAMLEQIGVPDEDVSIFKNYKIFPIDLLVKADWNYKKENEFTSSKLRNNLKRNGQVENIQVRELETGYFEVVNGNHRLDEMVAIGKSFVVAYDHGKISQAQAVRIATETNETRFDKDEEKLARLLSDLKIHFSEEDLLDTLPFTEDEFNDFLRISDLDLSSIPDPADVEDDDFNAPEPIRPITVRGDLYELNGHRLLCGDSTKRNDVERLMNGEKAHLVYTDPPYNINYAEFNKNRNEFGKDWTEEYCSEWEDSMSDEDYKKFLIDFMGLAKEFSIDWAHYYVWHATTYFGDVINAFVANGIPYDKVPIQWVKQVAPPSRVHYWRKSEPCIYGGKGAVNGQGAGARWFGPTNEVNIWNINRDHNKEYIHPTQKPVALASRAINNSSQPGEIVLDLFLGSGTTMIASDKMQRKCYGIDYEPKFCDLIVQRFMKHCADNNKECVIKLNGNILPTNYFEEAYGKKEEEQA